MKSKKNPKISVITAVYNGERFLVKTIESILNQTFKNFEYILINDCSKDKSLKIMKEYKKKDKRIVLINNKKNIGSASSRNLGLKMARGGYIAILDHDDLALPERLEKEQNYLEKNPDIFLVSGQSINIDEFGNETTKIKNETDLIKIKERLPKICLIHHSGVMYRNVGNLFYRDKIFYADDYDFFLRLLTEKKKLSNLEYVVTKYRVHKKCSSKLNSAKMYLFAQKAREFYFQRLKYGRDEYSKFNPEEILNINVGTSSNEEVLIWEIDSSFRLNDFKRVRRFCRRYFKVHGILNKICFYYFISFTGKKFVNRLRKVILFLLPGKNL